MTHPLREQLVGFLLGALDADERTEVEQELQRNPQLRSELETLRRCFDPLEGDEAEYEPPAGLADRTGDMVASFADNPLSWNEPKTEDEADDVRAFQENFGFDEEFGLDKLDQMLSDELAQDETPDEPPSEGVVPSSLHRARQEPVATPSRMSLADLIVVAGVLLAAAMLFFPAIASSRFEARVVACQNNLTALGRALANYSDIHGGYFPSSPAEAPYAGPGYYSVALRESELVDDSSTFFCPAGVLASGEPVHEPPTLKDVQQADARDRSLLRSRMGGSFGYTLGYMEGNRTRPIRNRGRASFALMSDMPSRSAPQWQSLNHGGKGQNVLFEDGRVAFVNSPQIADGEFFLSDRGFVEPGRHPDDAVIARSDTAPVIFVSEP